MTIVFVEPTATLKLANKALEVSNLVLQNVRVVWYSYLVTVFLYDGQCQRIVIVQHDNQAFITDYGRKYMITESGRFSIVERT